MCTHLELLDRCHVVAEHALFQHGDGVALTAHLLNLLTSAVATGSYITVTTGAPTLVSIERYEQITKLFLIFDEY